MLDLTIHSELTGYAFLDELCEYCVKTATTTQHYNFIFTETSMWYPVHPPSGQYFHDLRPTMPLTKLLNLGVFGDPNQAGRYAPSDKALLVFSLGLCSLHLLGGSWAKDGWNANTIHFSHQRTSSGFKIFNRHYPYVSAMLDGPLDQGGARPPTLQDYHSFLLSLARLLIEIETGKSFDHPPENFETSAWNEIARLRSSRINYANAIKGCLELIKSLPQPPRRKRKALNENDKLIDEIRKIIFTNVIAPLETDYKSLRVQQMPRSDPIDISATVGTLQQQSRDANGTLIPATISSSILFSDGEPVNTDVIK
jgi:hypothetical protein